MFLHHKAHISCDEGIMHRIAFWILIVQSSFLEIHAVSHTLYVHCPSGVSVHLVNARVPVAGVFGNLQAYCLCWVTEGT